MKIDFTKLDRAFNPRCVAVVGDKGKLQWLRNQSTFQGKLYSVQISPESIKAIEALGVENYTSLLDIPDTIDLVTVAVSRAVTPQILEDCIHKRVAAVHFFTAGFSETSTEEGMRLESQLIKRAKQANLYLIGPNCVGIFNPKIGIRQGDEQYTGFAGPVGFISQSGTHARDFALESHLDGVDINKSVSFGNGVVLDSPDYLEYFGHDDGIKVIGMYLEGVKDGRRFFSVLREVSVLKPVVIWKGGRTGEGAQAIASHTGSLAIPQNVWNAALRQSGAINVANMGELIDTIKALLYLLPVRGNRVGIIGGSGGQSVAITDAFTDDGLQVPLLTQESYDELVTFFSLIGASYRNPIDTGMVNRNEMRRIIEILERDANIDNLAILMQTKAGWRWDTLEELDGQIRVAVNIRKKTLKPVMVVTPFYTPEEMEQARNIARRLRGGGIPTFVTFERGARALKNALDYYSFKNSISNKGNVPSGRTRCLV